MGLDGVPTGKDVGTAAQWICEEDSCNSSFPLSIVAGFH